MQPAAGRRSRAAEGRGQPTRSTSRCSRFIEALEKEDLHSEPFKAKLDSAFQLGRQEISVAAGLMQGSLMQRNFVGATDTPAYKAIAAIRGQLDELNPGKDGDLLQPRKLLGHHSLRQQARGLFPQASSPPARSCRRP